MSQPNWPTYVIAYTRLLANVMAYTYWIAYVMAYTRLCVIIILHAFHFFFFFTLMKLGKFLVTIHVAL